MTPGRTFRDFMRPPPRRPTDPEALEREARERRGAAEQRAAKGGGR